MDIAVLKQGGGGKAFSVKCLDYRLDVQGGRDRRRMPSIMRPDRLWGPPSIPFSGFRELFRCVNWPGPAIDRSPWAISAISITPSMACNRISHNCHRGKWIWTYSQHRCGYNHLLVIPLSSVGIKVKMGGILFFRKAGWHLQTVSSRRRPQYISSSPWKSQISWSRSDSISKQFNVPLRCHKWWYTSGSIIIEFHSLNDTASAGVCVVPHA
jgi:hypothetical protein